MSERRRQCRIFSRGGSESGFTIVELLVVCVILMILAAIAMPVTKFAIKRGKETELRSQLRRYRNAIDEFKRYSDAGLLPLEFGTEGYPSELELLVEGVELVGEIDRKKRFLRRVAMDPMTGKDEWGLRSYQDEVDSRHWGGQNVYDVYSLSEGVGLNGIPYAEW